MCQEILTWQQCPKRGIRAGETAAVAEGEEAEVGTLLTAEHKYPTRSRLRKEGFVVAHSLRVQSVVAGSPGGRNRGSWPRGSQEAERDKGRFSAHFLFYSAQDQRCRPSSGWIFPPQPDSGNTSQTTPNQVCSHGDSKSSHTG